MHPSILLHDTGFDQCAVSSRVVSLPVIKNGLVRGGSTCERTGSLSDTEGAPPALSGLFLQSVLGSQTAGWRWQFSGTPGVLLVRSDRVDEVLRTGCLRLRSQRHRHTPALVALRVPIGDFV